MPKQYTEQDIEDARHDWALACNDLHDAIRSGSSPRSIRAANMSRQCENRLRRIEHTVAGAL